MFPVIFCFSLALKLSLQTQFYITNISPDLSLFQILSIRSGIPVIWPHSLIRHGYGKHRSIVFSHSCLPPATASGIAYPICRSLTSKEGAITEVTGVSQGLAFL